MTFPPADIAPPPPGTPDAPPSLWAGAVDVLAPPNNEAQARMGQLAHAFIAPWARGHGLARRLTLAVAMEARARGLMALNLDVRETQTAAIQLYESLGFERWGTNPAYAFVEGRMTGGHAFTLRLERDGMDDRLSRVVKAARQP